VNTVSHCIIVFKNCA